VTTGTLSACIYSSDFPGRYWCRLRWPPRSVCCLLERRRGTRAELAFLSDVRAGRYTVIESLSTDLERVAELVDTYDDLPLGTVDASVVALAERLRLGTIATLDRRDFVTVQPTHLQAFTLLP
jgi:predicted nucleic acid-binding protein